jgi:hypothetical protein
LGFFYSQNLLHFAFYGQIGTAKHKKNLIGGNIMDNAWRMIGDLVSNLTSVIIGILGLGIVGSLAFGDMLGLDVIGNITSLVESLATNGVVGLLVLAVLMSLVK